MHFVEFVACLFGFVMKLYDDLYDNIHLHKYKNPLLMEVLKGLTIITFTYTSIHDPLFCILFYIVSILNYLSNPHAYTEPYETSLLSHLFIFLLFKNGIQNE